MGFAETRQSVGRTLPDYEDPPVVETALAVRFAPVAGWKVTHFGQLLGLFREFYPKLELQPAIGGEIQFRVDAEKMHLPLRCWFLTDDQSQLVQVQDNMFVRNWRQVERQSEYKHYEEIRPLFERDWDLFLSFLREEHLPIPDVWQCEVTYINHLLRGREWKDFRDLADIFPVWHGMSTQGLFEKIDTAGFNVAFTLPEDSGKLQFTAQPAVRKKDGIEVIQLTVTALMRPSSSDKQHLLASLDIGRAAVVNGFTQFTSETVKKMWRIKP